MEDKKSKLAMLAQKRKAEALNDAKKSPNKSSKSPLQSQTPNSSHHSTSQSQPSLGTLKPVSRKSMGKEAAESSKQPREDKYDTSDPFLVDEEEEEEEGEESGESEEDEDGSDEEPISSSSPKHKHKKAKPAKASSSAKPGNESDDSGREAEDLDEEMEFLDQSLIIQTGRRTRGKKIDFTQFGPDPSDED